MSNQENVRIKPLENTLRVLISLTEKKYGVVEEFSLMKRLIEKDFNVDVDIEMLKRVYLIDLEIKDRELMYTMYGYSINQTQHIQ